MQRSKMWWGAAYLVVILIGVASCSGDSTPTTPSQPSDVAGTWSFVGQRLSDTCQALGYWQLQNITPPTTLTEVLNVTATGNPLIGQHVSGNLLTGTWQFSGLFINTGFSLAVLTPMVYPAVNGCILQERAEMLVPAIENDQGLGTFNVSYAGTETCSGSCQAVWTGIWTKQ